MAEDKFAFLTKGLDAPTEQPKDFSYLTQGIEPSGPAPIDDKQRMIIQNIFDTDSKKRKAYLKKLGWELGEDGNQIRPLGDDTPWDKVGFKIDYSPFEVPGEGKTLAAKIKAYANETKLDALDILSDLAIGSLSTVGTVGGIAAGLGGSLTPATAPAAPGLVVLGAIAGGAAGEAVGETFKQVAADEILGLPDSIPNDLLGMSVQAALSGILPVVDDIPGVKSFVRGGVDKARNYFQQRAKKATQNVVNQIEKTSSFKDRTRQILDKMTQRPQDFSPEIQDSALDTFKAQYRDMMGLADNTGGVFQPTKRPDKILPDSVFGKQTRLLEGKKQAAIDRIDQNNASNTTVGEYLEFLQREANSLSSVVSSQSKTDQESALVTLNKEIEQIAKDYAPKLMKQKVKGTKEKILPMSEEAIMKLAQDNNIKTVDLQGAKKSVSQLSKELGEINIPTTKSTVVTEMGMEPIETRELIETVRNKPMQFRELYRSFDRMQDLVYEADPVTGSKSTNKTLSDVAKNLENFRNTKAVEAEALLTNKGVQIAPEDSFVGSIQGQRDVLKAYNTMGSTLSSGDRAIKAFQGVDTIAKKDIIDSLKTVDGFGGTNYAEEFENLGLADALKKMRMGLENQGSKGEFSSILGETMKGIGAGGSVGFGIQMATSGAVPAAVPLAVVGGLTKGASAANQYLKYSSPERAFNTFRKAAENEQAAGSLIEGTANQAGKFINYLRDRDNPVASRTTSELLRGAARQGEDMTERTTEEERLKALQQRLLKGL